MASTKRSDLAAASVAIKRRKLGLVTSAVLGAEGFPHRMLQMLEKALPDCLGVPVEERHPFQQQLAGMTREVLLANQAKLYADVRQAEAYVEELIASKAAVYDKAMAASADLAGKAEDVRAAKAELAHSCAEVDNAHKTLVAIEGEEKNFNATLAKVERGQKKLQAALIDFLQPLKICTGIPDPKNVRPLLRLAKRFELDDTLTNAATMAFKKAPDQRTPFDASSLSHFEDALKQRLADLDAKLAEGELTRQSLKVAETAFTAEVASDAWQAAQVALEEAEKAKQAAEEIAKEAKQAAKAFEPNLKKAQAAASTARSKLDKFNEGPMAAYRELVEMTSMQLPAQKVFEAPIRTSLESSPAQAGAGGA